MLSLGAGRRGGKRERRIGGGGAGEWSKQGAERRGPA